MAKDREDSFIMLEKWYPRLVYALPKTEHVLFRYISNYRDAHINILNSAYPDTHLVFDSHGEDINILFKCCNINKDELIADVDKIELPKGVEEKKSLNAENVLFIMILRYYMVNKDEEKRKAFLLYFAYYIYSIRWWASFKPYGAKANIMQYTVNNLSRKFKLKELKSVEKWIGYTLTVSIDTYVDRFQKMSDLDIDYLISAFFSRISSGVKHIRDEYQTAYDNKNIIFQSQDTWDETGDAVERGTFTAEIEKLAMEFTHEFFSARPSSKRIKNAATIANISVSELQISMDLVFDMADIPEMREFFNCLFSIYFESIEYKDARDVSVKNIKFMQHMDSIFRKGNTKDVNILRAKELLDKWLTRGSNTFRKTKRTPTIADYRRGAYLYILMLVAGF